MPTTQPTGEAMDLQPTLTSEIILLRPLVTDDFEALFAIASDPQLWEQHPSKNRTQRPVLEEWFEGALTSGGALTALTSDGQEIVGTSRFANYRPADREVEIGWSFLARSRWGGRFNGEIKRLMLDYAFEHVDAVVFTVHSLNLRSQRAVEKLGAVRTGSTADPHGRGDNDVFRLTESLRPAIGPTADDAARVERFDTRSRAGIELASVDGFLLPYWKAQFKILQWNLNHHR